MTKLAWTASEGGQRLSRRVRRRRPLDRVMRRGVWRLYERRHADMVRFAAFLTGDVHAAEDVAQEAFVRLLDAWDRLDDPDRADAYLRATIVNLVRSDHRRRASSPSAARHLAPRARRPRPRTTPWAASVASTCSTPWPRCHSASVPAS